LHCAILSVTNKAGSQNATSQQTSAELETAVCNGSSKNRFGIAPRSLDVAVGHFATTADDTRSPLLNGSHVTVAHDR